MNDASGVRQLLAEHGVKSSKSLGQNFLTDANIPAKIVRLSGIDKTCGVLEIGPGLGALTGALSRAAGFVTAVELDNRLTAYLKDLFRDDNNIEIIQGDILKLDIAELAREKMPGMPLHVCANLPYSITSPVVTAVTLAGVFTTVTVMVQKEVAARICAAPGTPEYGALTVFLSYHYAKREALFDVPGECFTPRPKVTSSVVRMTARAERLLLPGDEEMLFRVVRGAFSQRRKTLVNALHGAFGATLTKNDIAEAVVRCGLDARIRGEVLGVDEFIRLSEALLAINNA